LSRIARWRLLAAGLALSLFVVACGPTVEEQAGREGQPDGGEAQSGDVEPARSIDGAGATFPAPLYSEVFSALAEQEGIQVNYQSIGSGGGIEQFTNRTVDFGASDAPMTDEQIQQAGGDVLHVATVGGAVVPTYNLPGVEELNLTGEVLADIFLGNVTRWNDPAIAELNPDADLPDEPIQVVHRSDGSGTTFIFVEYLSAVSEEWADEVGSGTEVAWPTGSGASGNEGVAAQVSQTPYSIGYNELAYATENDIPYARLADDPEGPFVEANIDTASAAIAAAEVPDDLRVSISGLNVTEGPEGQEAYPITGLTWLLIRQEMDDLATCKAVAQAAWFATHEGQEFAPPDYVPIGGRTLEIGEEFIRSMEAQGQPCYEE
jgi:phosphate transport system substrate-binding protein